jgi:creatinine amidohydrolase
VFLEQLKWMDVDALPRRETILVCCISAMEQHSLHMPLGTDYIIGTEIVRRLEAVMPLQLLCIPTVWLGASSHHLDFAGTISASAATMRSILHDIVASAHHQGFRKVLFLNSHGGNRSLLGCAVQEVGVELPNMQVVGATYWEVAHDRLSQLRETTFGGMGHACELETSIVLAVRPELVDMQKAKVDGIMSESEFARGEMLSAPSVAVYKTFKEITKDGGYGDPLSASAEKGEQMLSAITARLTELCQHMIEERI